MAARPFASVASRPFRSTSARAFSVAAAATTSSVLRTTAAYDSATFQRVGSTFAVKSTLLAGTPFSAPIASRNFSLWPSNKPANTDAQQTASDVAQDFKDSAQSTAQSVQSHASGAVQRTQDAASNTLQQTEEVASDTLASLQQSAHEAATHGSDAFVDVDPTAAGTVTEAFGSAMGVQAGELTKLGLNHWASPVGWVTNLLETVGLYTGLPWWGTIMVTTLMLRFALAPLNISGQKNAIRLGNIQPKMKLMMEDVKSAKASGDQLRMQQSVAEVQALMRKNNTNPIKSITPVLVQLPLMFSFYLALSRIASSGSFSFAHGGPWWTFDLTSPDPTYILPLVSTVATLAVAEVSFLLGTNASADAAQTQMMKWLFRGFMPVIGYFATSLPSAVLVYWATTNIWSLLQLLILQIPIVRKWAQFPKRITPPVNPYAPKPKGIIEQIKERAANQSKPAVIPVAPSPKASATSRSDALQEMLADDKAAPAQSNSTPADGAKPTSSPKPKLSSHAQRKIQRQLDAQERRRRN